LAGERVERKLAAILAADVAGYSRLIGADEEGTLSRLKALRADVIDPKIAEHHGRIVKTTGDGLLVEFASVVDALRCAAEIQAAMAESNAPLSADTRLDLRIGINMGDIVVEDGDIFGDGVNVAARLEGLAEPGGICVPARVQEDAAGKLDLAFEDIGEQQLKNIARSIRVFRVGAKRVALPSEQPATPTLQPAVAPRLSIVVLPFANLGNDPEQEYFADGITEDLTTDLSRIAGMLVISRNTAFTYRNQRVDTKQIGRDLAVRYVLEGSVRRSGNQVRVNAQLIEAESDTHLWAERFDGEISDLFALQDEVVSRIAIALNLELPRAEAARPTHNPDALDYFLRGRALMNKQETRDNFAESISLLERALVLDPQSIQALTYLAHMLTARVLNGMTGSPVADIERAEELIAQALAQSPNSPLAHYVRGQLLRIQNRHHEAVVEYETALASDRNLVLAYSHIGQYKLFAGSVEESILYQERAIRLSPRSRTIHLWYARIGIAHLVQSQTDESIHWLERARNANPAMHLHHAWLAATYALKGDIERAAFELAQARSLSSDDRYSSIARLQASGYFAAPTVRALFETTFFAGLRKAGMPEE
jgi:TolB-like protein/class 3 adenylate cyclase